ncbi:MAG: HAMP domain-containing histidine kinase [Candidatus Taylorbacteria bacterium]|nr:HAMP domain-containing histidine kinase [Candidatus Taylorbacteria bacterium]
MKQKVNYKIFFFLTLPLLLLLGFIAIMIMTMKHLNVSVYMGASFVAFVICMVLEIYTYRSQILPRISETDKIKKLLEAQDRSGKLLLRRDLELTLVNDKLRELDLRKSEFVSIVAHQLRTPLSGIKWTLDMLLKEDLGSLNNEQKTFLMKTYESNERMVKLIDDMLSADRVDSGKLHYSFLPTDLFDLFDNVLFDLLLSLNKKHLKVNFINRITTFPKVDIDPEKMRAVLQNLLDNAVKYSKEGGSIGISATHEGDLVKVMIKDDGIGIPEMQQKYIFERFFRATNALLVETDGTGLGLFIVKGIIERHGGTIWYESKEGHGTTFYFTIKINK